MDPLSDLLRRRGYPAFVPSNSWNKRFPESSLARGSSGKSGGVLMQVVYDRAHPKA